MPMPLYASMWRVSLTATKTQGETQKQQEPVVGDVSGMPGDGSDRKRHADAEELREAMEEIVGVETREIQAGQQNHEAEDEKKLPPSSRSPRHRRPPVGGVK